MRKGILFLALFAFIACSNSSSEVIDEKEQLKPEQPVDGTLTADGNSAKTYDLIKRSGYNHEAPTPRANIRQSTSNIFSRCMTTS